MPYVQPWKGSYRFRRRVPDHLVRVFGKREWVQALGTKNRAEANRRVIPHIERTNEDIRDAEHGNWPRIDDERLSEIAGEWWQWHLETRAKWLKLPVGLVGNGIDGDDLALTGEGQLGASLTRFITARGLEVRPSSSTFARLKRECQILHHERTGGYYGEIDARREATVKILDAIASFHQLRGPFWEGHGAVFGGPVGVRNGARQRGGQQSNRGILGQEPRQPGISRAEITRTLYI
jgi:hypothetical protein